MQSISGDNTYDSGLKAGEDPVLLNEDLKIAVSVIEILTISDFDQVRGTLGGAFKLAVDLTFDSPESWVPIGDFNNPFTGSFDGQNFTISGLYSSSDKDYIGLFGYTNGATLENINLKNVNIQGGSNVGGLAGYAVNSTIINCSVAGEVKGIGNSVGGLVGSANRINISECSSSGSVEGNGNSVGGLVGYIYINSSITNSYALKTVHGGSQVGGLVGRIWNANSIINCYSAAVVSGSGDSIGGLVGSRLSITDKNTCSDSFWDIELSGQANSALGEGKTTEEMKEQATFTGWDFDAIWLIKEKISYPLLQWQFEPEEPLLPPTPGPGLPAEKPAQTFEGFSPDYTGFLVSNYILVYRYLEEAERIIALLQTDPEKITALNLDLIRGSFNKAKLLFSQYHDYYNETERKSISERLRLINQNIVDFENGL